MNAEVDANAIERRACRIRADTLAMIASAGSGHPGGSLSCADILATLFFSGVMRYDQSDPLWSGRDRFVLSKGHAAPALYATFRQLGWVSDGELGSLRKLGSRLQGHPDSKALLGVEVCTGSLGQGLSVGVGMALGLRLSDGEKARELRRVFVLCGDGELQEGSNWEALMYAAHRELANITLLIDANGLQIDGRTNEVCSLGNLPAKLRAFGWDVWVVDGHDIGILYDAMMCSKKTRPSAVVCRTVKGRGVSFMEDKRGWHGKAPDEEQLALALEELRAGSSDANEVGE